MQFIDIPTEQTTAVTDILLALVSAIGITWIIRTGHRIDRQKTIIWTFAFALLMVSAILGAIAHGIKMSEETNKLIWQPLNLFLGLSVAFFAIGVIYDLQQFRIQKSVVILILTLGFIFFAVTLIFPGLFFVFIVYEALTMLFALTSYLILFVKKKFTGANYMTTGILLSIAAAYVQSDESFSLDFIWKFDHNGLFHLIQIMGLFFLFSGLVKEFESRRVQ
jgi:hypothetical protein